MIALRIAGLHATLRSAFAGSLGGLPVTYEVAVVDDAPPPGLEIELARDRRRDGVAVAPDHPRFHARRDGEALIVERPDCLGRIDLAATPIRARFELGNDPYALEACVRVAISVALPRHGAMIVHSSAVRWAGDAHVFAGVSGAGKSTIAALLRDAFPACERLADELTVLARGSGGWRVHVPPFLGISDLPRGAEAPLAGLHLIAQATGPSRTALSTSAAARELLRHVVIYAAEPATTALVLELVHQLAEEVPCDRLEFALDPSVGRVLGLT